MIQNKDIVVAKGDTKSIVVIMKKSDYVTKLDTMIEDGIMKGTYVEILKTRLKDYRDFRTFYIYTFINVSAIKIWNLIAINQRVFMEQLKPTNLKI